MILRTLVKQYLSISIYFSAAYSIQTPVCPYVKGPSFDNIAL
jgi:hypothetical protein